MNGIISLRKLTLGYGSRKEYKKLFDEVSLEIPQGELISLLGRNGTGKSTLLKAIAGLIKPLSGELFINGGSAGQLSAEERARLLSFVSTDAVKVHGFTVWDVVALGRSPYTNWIGRLTAEDHAKVSESLTAVHMETFAEKSIDTLSDGERQRVMIARALAQDTPVILLDEPTAFLDIPNKYEIAKLLKKLSQEMGKSIIYSTHDLNVAMKLSDEMIIVDQGKFLTGTPSEFRDNGVVSKIFGTDF